MEELAQRLQAAGAVGAAGVSASPVRRDPRTRFGSMRRQAMAVAAGLLLMSLLTAPPALSEAACCFAGG
jgi:hypothetical protein